MHQIKAADSIDNMTLMELPREVLAQIFYNLTDISDLIAVSSICRTARQFCSRDNQLLWQCMYLHNYDDPKDVLHRLTKAELANRVEVQRELDWYEEMRKRVPVLRRLKYLEYRNDELKQQEIQAMTNVLLDMLDTAKACPTPEEVSQGIKARVDDRIITKNLNLLPSYPPSDEFDAFVRGLPLRPYAFGKMCSGEDLLSMPGSWENAGRSGPITRSQANIALDKIERSDAACRLHVLCGISPQEMNDEKYLSKARRIVYDWDLTNRDNDFALFKSDGSGDIDWRRLEAAMTVASRQFSLAVRSRMNVPLGLCFSIPYRTLSDPTVPNDWARCSGGWSGTYVFLHWEDLVEYNTFRNAANRPTLDNGPEACGGLMKLEIRLNMALKDDPKLKSEIPSYEDEQYPPLYFSGLSKSYDYQMATGLRGTVCLTKGGREVRWRFIVHYSGSDQWQLEGIQPGGIRSGSVYGLWTSCTHEEGGPVGSFMYTPDELCKSTSVVLHRRDD